MNRKTDVGTGPQYLIDPCSPFPKHWKDKIGPIRVMAEPTQGYVMVRRPGAMPFVLHVRHLLNAERHPTHGPFEVVRKSTRRSPPLTTGGE